MVQPSGTGIALNQFGQWSARETSIPIWKLAEFHVSEILRQQGWKIYVRNFRWIGTEIDILAGKNGTIIAVEVKYRKKFNPDMQSVSALLPRKKIRSLHLGLQSACKKMHLNPRTTRVDLAILTSVRDMRGAQGKLKVPQDQNPCGTHVNQNFRIWWYPAASS